MCFDPFVINTDGGVRKHTQIDFESVLTFCLSKQIGEFENTHILDLSLFWPFCYENRWGSPKKHSNWLNWIWVCLDPFVIKTNGGAPKHTQIGFECVLICFLSKQMGRFENTLKLDRSVIWPFCYSNKCRSWKKHTQIRLILKQMEEFENILKLDLNVFWPFCY